MTNTHDSDILITQTDDDIHLNLKCGYGQPCVTTIYQKLNDGTTKKLLSCDNNQDSFKIGPKGDLFGTAIDIHTTIHDIRDSNDEREDISLEIEVYCSNEKVDTGFTRKTKGKGHIIHSFYTVTII